MKIINLSALILLTSLSVNAQKFTDKVNLSKGQKIEIISDSKQTMTMTGMDMNSKSTTTLEGTVVDISGDNYIVKAKVSKLKLSSSGSGYEQEFDSEKPDKNSKEMNEALKEKLNVEESYSIDGKTGAVTSLTAVDNDDIMEDLMNGSSNISGALNEMFLIIPDGKKKGDSWTVIKNDKGMNILTTYTLKDVRGNVATVDFKVFTNIKTTSEMQGMEVAIDMKINNAGTLYVNTTTGIVSKKNSTAKTDGSTEVMGQTMEISSEAKVENTFSVK